MGNRCPAAGFQASIVKYCTFGKRNRQTARLLRAGVRCTAPTMAEPAARGAFQFGGKPGAMGASEQGREPLPTNEIHFRRPTCSEGLLDLT
ncbi:MAG: hypothetical protein Kow00123_25440 [Anaerolineales bacterium]